MEWEVLLTAEVEAFLDDLYMSDPLSHQLVNQAILVVERSAIPRAEQLYEDYLSERRKEMGP